MRNSPSARIWISVALLLGVLLFVLNAARFLVKDAPQNSDIILVLAGETDRRPARALELLRQGWAPRLLIDVPAEARLYDVSQLELARRYAQSLPEGDRVDICPVRGLSTRDESHDAERCLASEKASRILIVTSDFHTRRSLSIFRHELRDKSFSISATYDDAQFGMHWWTHRQWAKTCLDEWLRLIWWNAAERWN